MNIILLDPAELTDNRVILRDRRADHIRSVLGAACGDTLRIGIINGPMGTSRVVSITADAVELETSHTGPAPPRPDTDLILALPRPIMLKRIFSQAATLGVGRIFLINASRVEKSFFSASLLHRENYYPLLLHGLEQAVDTMVPEVMMHHGVNRRCGWWLIPGRSPRCRPSFPRPSGNGPSLPSAPKAAGWIMKSKNSRPWALPLLPWVRAFFELTRPSPPCSPN